LKRVVVLGATGVFGERLARRLATWDGIQLVIAARGRPALERLAAKLSDHVEIAVVDRSRPQTIAALQAFAVVDCSGPFQQSSHDLPRAVLASGAHYLDLADGRAFVAEFALTLNDAALAAGRLAVTGVSSTPALSHAVLDQLTAGWTRIDRVHVGISPGARAPRGLAVMRAILSWVGRPVRLFTDGGWRTRPGWAMTRRIEIPGLGRRWLGLAETPDLDLLVTRFTPRREALFQAGLELSLMHLGLWLLSWPVRLGLLKSLAPIARPLLAIANLLDRFGSDRGGMVVSAFGADSLGHEAVARWSLVAEQGCGPNVPILPAAALLRALVDGRITATGAVSSPGLLTLEDILAEIGDLPIRCRTDRGGAGHMLWPGLFGAAFAALPRAVRRIHTTASPKTFKGQARARGGAGLAAVVRGVAGMPRPGAYPNFAVDIIPSRGGERWIRHFGRRGFASRIEAVRGDVGRFEERVGPLVFRFEPIRVPDGFTWRQLGWRFGPIPLPNRLAPRIRARTFARNGLYRFRVLIAHPLIGIIAGYSGWLLKTEPIPPGFHRP
jgi:hypothetical protein